MPDCLTAVMPVHGENGTVAHCRRVAILASEVAEQLELSPEDRQLVFQTALLHHSPLEVMEGSSLVRLTADLWGSPESREPLADADLAPPEVMRVLKQLHPWCSSDVSAKMSRLAAVVELCDLYDQKIEYSPYDTEDTLDPVRDLAEISDARHWPREFTACLGRLHSIEEKELWRALGKLAVSPGVAMRLLQLPAEEESCFDELLMLIRSDQTLAFELLRVANSGAASPCDPISSVESALAYVGAEEARRVLTAASFRPLLSASSASDLWRHSLEAAGITERLAEMSGAVDPAQAYLAGLIHDVGRLALQQLPSRHTERLVSLGHAGTPPVFGEMVLCGMDHGGIGAASLERWKFPDSLVTALRYHHCPEKTESKLAAILYLAEHWSNSEEDLPSVARLRTSTERLGIDGRSLGALDDGKTWRGAALGA